MVAAMVVAPGRAKRVANKVAATRNHGGSAFRWACRFAGILWASPNSLLGLLIGAVGLLGGGRVRWRDGCLEFWGGGVTWFLQRMPVSPAAMTLGHVILGLSPEMLSRAAEHERVHVRQYERWGPLFLPAYGLCSLWVWCRGGNAYMDNPFEVEAYTREPGG